MRKIRIIKSILKSIFCFFSPFFCYICQCTFHLNIHLCGTQAFANQGSVIYHFSFLTIMPPHLKALVQKKSTNYLQSFTKLGKLYIVFNEHCEILGSIKKGNIFPTKGKGNM